jgi:hypothetical protein
MPDTTRQPSPIILGVIGLLIITVAPHYANIAAEPAAFELHSGHAEQPSAAGSWHLRLTEFGTLAVSHIQNAEGTVWETFYPEQDTLDHLWEMILAVDTPGFDLVERDANPGEVYLECSLEHGLRGWELAGWSGGFDIDADFRELLDELEELIEELTGRRAVLH